MEDFLSDYLEYTKGNEAPAIYHRWSIISAISAFLERNLYVKQGHFNIYPNLYIVLIGAPGTKKNTAINISSKILKQAGYNYFSASKSSKEKLFIDLSKQGKEDINLIDSAELNIFNGHEADSSVVQKMYICSGELQTFFGNNVLDFMKDLGELWDKDDIFKTTTIKGKDIIIYNPTISLIGGITPQDLAESFPPQMIGQGFFSRCLFIHGERTREKITFQKPVDDNETKELSDRLRKFTNGFSKDISYTSSAAKLIDKIYRGPELLIDGRFASYYNRRWTQLWKLMLICTVSQGKKEIDEAVVRHANTILTYAEKLMPKALGEFGKARNSGISNDIVDFIEKAEGIVKFKDILVHVRMNIDKPIELAGILNTLVMTEVIQQIPSKSEYLPRRRVIEYDSSDTLDYDYLSDEEKRNG